MRPPKTLRVPQTDLVFDLWPIDEFLRDDPGPDYFGHSPRNNWRKRLRNFWDPKDDPKDEPRLDGEWSKSGSRIRKSATATSPPGRWITIPEGYIITRRKNPHAVALGRKGGLAGKGKTSPAKARAARKNGTKGGRPRKKPE